METIELKGVVEKAMDLIVDDKPEIALTTLWCLHRALRGISFTIDMPDEGHHEITPSRHETPEMREARLAKDRERKRVMRQRELDKASNTPKALPPMKPINGKVKPTAAREIRCLKCGADPGQPCTGFTSAGKWGKPTGEPIKTFHTSRIRVAQAMTMERQTKAVKQQAMIDQAKQAEMAQ